MEHPSTFYVWKQKCFVMYGEVWKCLCEAKNFLDVFLFFFGYKSGLFRIVENNIYCGWDALLLFVYKECDLINASPDFETTHVTKFVFYHAKGFFPSAPTLEKFSHKDK